MKDAQVVEDCERVEGFIRSRRTHSGTEGSRVREEEDALTAVPTSIWLHSCASSLRRMLSHALNASYQASIVSPSNASPPTTPRSSPFQRTMTSSPCSS